MPTTYSLRGLLPGLQGTTQTLSEMAKMVRKDSRDPRIVAVARAIISDVPAHDEKGEVKAVYDFIKNSIRYTQDPIDTEWIQDSTRSLEFGAGDCDDLSTALASYLGAVGYMVRFVVGSYDSDPASQYDHVWVQTLVKGNWIDLDASENKYPGWQPPGFARLGSYPIFGEDMAYGYYFGHLGQDGQDAVDTGNFDTVDFVDPTSVDPSLNDNSFTSVTDVGAPVVLDALDTSGIVSSDGFFNVDGMPSVMNQNSDGSFSINNAATGEFDSYDANGNLTSIYMPNSDGTFTLTDANGNTTKFDQNGNAVSAPTPTPNPSVVTKAKDALSHALNSTGGGSSGGFPSGGAGGGAKPSGASSSPSLSDISSLINSITKSITGILNPTASSGLITRINPATGQLATYNAAGQLISSSPLGNTGLNTTTLLIIGLVAFLALRK